jgi:hypothetical protein
MGFNKCILPSIEVMQSEIDRSGLAEFVRIYTKYDSIMGESERMEFLENKIDEYEKLKQNINSNNTNP